MSSPFERIDTPANDASKVEVKKTQLQQIDADELLSEYLKLRKEVRQATCEMFTCYSARGDKSETALMVTRVYERLTGALGE